MTSSGVYPSVRLVSPPSTGGKSIFREYHACGKGRGANFSEINGFFAKLSQGAAYQLQSRDVYRVSKLLPLERRASLFFSVFSFYVANAITMYVVHITTVLYALLAVSNLLTTYTGMTTDLRVLGAHYPLLFMIVLTLPDIILVCFEEGLRGGFRGHAAHAQPVPFQYHSHPSQGRLNQC